MVILFLKSALDDAACASLPHQIRFEQLWFIHFVKTTLQAYSLKTSLHRSFCHTGPGNRDKIFDFLLFMPQTPKTSYLPWPQPFGLRPKAALGISH